MDYNEVLRTSKLKENFSKLNELSDEYFELLETALSLMTEDELKQLREASKEDYSKGIKQMQDNLANAKKSLNDLITGLKSDPKNVSAIKTEKAMVEQDIKYANTLVNQINELEKKLNNPDFQEKAKEMIGK